MESRNKGTFLRTRPATAQSSPHICPYSLGGLLIHQEVEYSSQHGLRRPISIRAKLKVAFTKCHRLPFLLTFIVPQSFVNIIAVRDHFSMTPHSALLIIPPFPSSTFHHQRTPPQFMGPRCSSMPLCPACHYTAYIKPYHSPCF